MGCFLGCFGGRNSRRRQKRRESDQASANKIVVESAKPDHLNDRVPTVEEIPKASVIPITEICENDEEKCSPSPTMKRVTFDSKVKTYEHIALQESIELLKEEEVKSEEISLKSSKTDQSSSSENVNVTSNSSASDPSNHRYKNCRESDDDDDDDEVEDDELDCDESDLEEYYSDDGVSEDKLRHSTKEANTEEIGDNGLEIDAMSRGVLNPVENLTQWKSAKSKGRTIQKQTQKENSNLISHQEDKGDSISFGETPQIDDISPNLKSKSKTELKTPRNQELAVDTSLSTWLSKSETDSECNSVSKETPTPEKNKSSCYPKRGIFSHDDRPILCPLTLEEIKQFSATSTPRKSPSKSPDETPIIGTVGGYWGNQPKATDCGSASSFKGIPNTTSKYREDNKVKWHSTPFETRLEKALNSIDH